MTESELLFEISNLVNRQNSFSQAVQQIAGLLEREGHAKALFLQHPGAPDAAALLESFDQPYRSLYTVDLRGGGEALGRATLCFASDRFLGSFPQRISEFVGEQLGMLLARTRLSERRAHLKREIEKIETELATRKLMQRAEGILMARRKMTPADAKKWIALQSRKTGLSENDVADRVIAYHQATGLAERRIA